MVHITTVKDLEDLIACDPKHYVVHYGYPWPELELEEAFNDYENYATVAYCKNPANDDDPGLLIGTIEYAVFDQWNRGEGNTSKKKRIGQISWEPAP